MTSTSATAADGATADAGVSPEQRRLAHTRRPGEALVRVLRTSPSLASVLVVVDDQPLLVDAVVAAIERVGVGVRRVEHPVVAVDRDANGAMLGWGPPPHDTPSEDASPGDTAQRDPGSDGVRESWIAVEIAAPAEDDHARVRDEVTRVISRIIGVHEHRGAMTAVLRDLAAQPSRSEADRDLLRWLADDHFVIVGQLAADLDAGVWSTVRGVFVDETFDRPAVPDVDASHGVHLSRMHLPTGTIRTSYPTVVRVVDGSAGRVHLYVGALTSIATLTDVTETPVLADTARAVLDASGTRDDSFTGAALAELLHQHPRTDLFGAEPTALAADLLDVAEAVTARDVRVRIDVDANAEICSVRIYVPRERYTTRLRETMQRVIVDRLSGRDPEYSVRISESPRAFVHVLLSVDRATCERLTGPSADATHQQAIADEVAATARTWDDQFADLALDEIGGTEAAGMIAWASALPATYKDAHDPRTALQDAEVLAPLADGEFDVRWDGDSHDGRVTLGLYLCRRPASLTSVLPMLQSLGVDVLDEHPFTVTRSDGMDCWIYEFTVVPLEGGGPIHASPDTADRFTDAFAAMWTGSAEVDDFNILILRCGLSWRQVTMIRAYARYLRQCGFAYSAAHVAEVLADYPDVTIALVELFETSFDPTRTTDDARQNAVDELAARSADVVGLDADRIVSAFTAVIEATSRTSFYANDVATHALSVKLRPRDIPQTPLPRPLHEIFVYSPRVEGVHLRFGAVARGGLRWSDRREDFRTEILGLVKAQAVKNAVIVPVGAKGGFVVKRPPVTTGGAAADRDAARAEGIACYREFISGLLSLTDSIAGTDRHGQKVVPAPGVVRRDGDDTYLVVAADKGTAAFSDVANDVAAQHDYWLGDAFASGGSVGYDHKAMGITARGAWESVRRHFRELGTDVDTDDFTVVGIGDMSGDVFGNGMLLSRHIRLVAAFDHRHVMLDPDPDADTSFDERRRLFDLPRSSWADYDTRLISTGGGVWSRDTKSVPIGPEVRAALGLVDHVTALSPPELIHAILLAPVDLLWNGGIGTYVKASTESHSDVGDKANDPIRVDGRDVRATVIGEGGNLGVTEAGRIEYDLFGGHVNTDALDNSAGVDCSDHEVNIKILLDAQVAGGRLGRDDRDALLHEMTDEVGALVLADNVAQNFELGTARAQSVEMAPVHARLLDQLADVYGVDLALEVLPRGDELSGRGPDGDRIGLTSPELATAMAHVKLGVKRDLLDGELPDNDIFTDRLIRYFPSLLRERYADGAADHPLRREIVTTSLVNDVVDSAGLEHVFSLAEGAGCSSTDVVRAWVVIVETFDLRTLWTAIAESSAPIPAVTEMVVQWRRLLFRGSRWMIAARPQPLAVTAEVTRYAQAVRDLSPSVPGWLGERSRAVVVADTRERVRSGVAEPLAREVAGCLHRFCLLDVIDAADIADREPAEAGAVYFAMMELLGIEDLLTAVSALESADRWRSLARLALRDDLFAVLRGLTLAVLHVGEPDESAAEKVEEWQLHNAARFERTQTTLDEIRAAGLGDLATLSVAARALRSLIR